METFALAYWWLIFPVMWFAFGLMRIWDRYHRHQAALDLMKTYAEHGRDPGEIAGVLDAGPPWGSRWERRAWRYGPFWAWRKAVMSGCAAIGFWLAADYLETPFRGPLTIVAIIMSVVAAGSLVVAIGSSLFSPRPLKQS